MRTTVECTRSGRAQSEMAQESLMQVSGSFLESRTAKIDAPAVCTHDSTRRLQEMYSNRTGCLELAMIMPVRGGARNLFFSLLGGANHTNL